MQRSCSWRIIASTLPRRSWILWRSKTSCFVQISCCSTGRVSRQVGCLPAATSERHLSDERSIIAEHYLLSLQMLRRQATATFPLTTPSSWRCVTSSRCVIANGWMSTACRWSDSSERESSLNDCLIFQSVRRIGDGGRCESRRAQKQSQGLCMIKIPILLYMYCLLCIQILEVYWYRCTHLCQNNWLVWLKPLD